MAKVSFLIPARGETFENLSRTVESIYENAQGEFEILIGFDGKPYYNLGLDKVKQINFPDVVGIKTNINALAAMATGKYIYKSDAHCRFDWGFDEVLKAKMEDDWIVMPRFKILTPDWQIQQRDGKDEYYDYFYLSCPLTDPKGFRFKAGGHWKERTDERDPFVHGGDYLDETPQIHGSGWFMTKDRYFELGGFPNIDPYGHAQEPIWLALKNWLAGGKVMVNKQVSYAHLHQQGNKRGYHMDKTQEDTSYRIAAEYWMADKWCERQHDIAWFVDEKFPGMPTWLDDWKERRAKWLGK